jgi:hypothetical protein
MPPSVVMVSPELLKVVGFLQFSMWVAMAVMRMPGAVRPCRCG